MAPSKNELRRIVAKHCKAVHLKEIVEIMLEELKGTKFHSSNNAVNIATGKVRVLTGKISNRTIQIQVAIGDNHKLFLPLRDLFLPRETDEESCANKCGDACTCGDKNPLHRVPPQPESPAQVSAS